jgi:hypothetical protein
MNIGNIKNHSMAVLEQACERYAVMAFEELNGRLAIGLQSIRYSYQENRHNADRGEFVAEFVPWNASDCPRKQDRRMTVEWGIIPVGKGLWKLYGGMASVQNEPGIRNIAWAGDGTKMLFLLNDEDVDVTGYKGSVTI